MNILRTAVVIAAFRAIGKIAEKVAKKVDEKVATKKEKDYIDVEYTIVK